MKNILKNKPRGDVIAQLTALKSWSQNPTAYEKKLNAFVKSEDPVPRQSTHTGVAQKMTKLDSMDAMYKSMTPIEKGQFNFDLRKRYGHDYIRFRNNNKNIK